MADQRNRSTEDHLDLVGYTVDDLAFFKEKIILNTQCSIMHREFETL